MKPNPLATAEFRELQREIYSEKIRECTTIEEGVLALLDAHLEACEIALTSEPAPAPARMPAKPFKLETQHLLGAEGLTGEEYAYVYGATEAVENALDEERSSLEDEEIPQRYEDIIQANSRVEREYRYARLDYLDALDRSDLEHIGFYFSESVELLIAEGLLTSERAEQIKNAITAYKQDRARYADAVKSVNALPDPDAVPANEQISRFNLRPELVRKLQKHNISLDARLKASSDQRSQLPYLISLFDSVWAYDVFMSQSLERYPARVAFTVDSELDEQIAHALACQHARSLENYTDRKFNRFLSKRGRKPLPPRASRKAPAAPAPSAPSPAPAPAPAPSSAPAPAPAPVPAQKAKRGRKPAPKPAPSPAPAPAPVPAQKAKRGRKPAPKPAPSPAPAPAPVPAQKA